MATKSAGKAVTLLSLGLSLALSACGGSAGNQRAVGTFIDGWPVLPARDDFCREYEQNRKKEGVPGAAPARAEQTKVVGSRHRPYAERHCSGCHDTSQGISSTLLKPKEQLCFMCHRGLLTGRYGHGPAVNGECLACHEPHESMNESLLVKTRKEICSKCHEEKRAAEQMHHRISEAGLACPDCHAPHSSPLKHLLK